MKGLSGGARPVSGPPKKTLDERQLTGQAKLRERRTRQHDTDEPSYVPRPEELSADARRKWDRWAPHALAAHTLTPATSGAFADLCTLWALQDQLARKVNRDDWQSDVTTKDGRKKAHPLATEYARVRHEVRQIRIRFMLEPCGRPMEFVPPATSSLDTPTADPLPLGDPWAQFDQPLQAVEPSEIEHGIDDPRRPH